MKTASKHARHSQSAQKTIKNPGGSIPPPLPPHAGSFIDQRVARGTRAVVMPVFVPLGAHRSCSAAQRAAFPRLTCQVTVQSRFGSSSVWMAKALGGLSAQICTKIP